MWFFSGKKALIPVCCFGLELVNGKVESFGHWISQSLFVANIYKLNLVGFILIVDAVLQKENNPKFNLSFHCFRRYLMMQLVISQCEYDSLQSKLVNVVFEFCGCLLRLSPQAWRRWARFGSMQFYLVLSSILELPFVAHPLVTSV